MIEIEANLSTKRNLRILAVLAGLGLLLAFPVSHCRAQPDPNNAPKAANPPSQRGWSRKQMLANFEQNVRDYLNAVEMTDTATQDAVLEYFEEATTYYAAVTAPAALELRSTANKLGEAFEKNALTEAATSERLFAHSAAMEAFTQHRQTAVETLEAKTGFSKNARLRAALLLLGVGTDAPPFITLESLYGVDADNPPRDNLERWQKSKQKPTAARWAVWDDPARYEARRKWTLKTSMQWMMNEHDITEKATQNAVLAYVAQRDQAQQELAVLAMSLYAALTNYEPAMNLDVNASLAEYEAGLRVYNDRIQQLAQSLEAETDYTNRPRLEAILYMKGGLGGTATTIWDRGTEYWLSVNYKHLFGRGAQ